MIHISDIRKFERCPALLWRSCHEPQSYLPFVHPCASISDLAVLYFDLHDYFEGKANDDPSLALQALNEKEALVNARFEAQGVRVKITLMRKGKHGFHIYFGYRSCYPHESEAQQIADHLTVLKALGIEIEDVSILCLNAGYVRKQWLDVRTLLLVTDCLFNQKNKQRHTVQELCEPLMRDLCEISAACEMCLSATAAVNN